MSATLQQLISYLLLRQYDARDDIARDAGNALKLIASGSGGAFPLVNIVTVYGADPTGVADSAPALQAAVTALAGTGFIPYAPPGLYKVASTVALPPGKALTFLGSGRASVLESTQAPLGGQQACIFHAQPAYTSNEGTIEASPNIGVASVRVTLGAPPTAGLFYEVGQGTGGGSIITAQLFKALAVTLVSGLTFDITTDVPVAFGFTSGADTVVKEATAVPQDILLMDFAMTGTGDRWIEVLCGQRCLGVSLYGNGVAPLLPSDAAASFDVGSSDCFWRNCEADLTGTPGTQVYGWMSESNVGGGSLGCAARGCTGGASFLTDGSGVWNTSCVDQGGSAIGFVYGQGGGLGALACGATDSVAQSATGFSVNVGAGVAFHGCTALGSATGLATSASSSGTYAAGFVYQGSANTVNALALDGSAIFDALEIGGPMGPINVVNVLGSGDVRINSGSLAVPAGANGINAEAGFAARLDVCNFTLSLSEGANGLLAQGGVVSASNVKVGFGAGTTTGVLVGAAGTFRQGPNCDFDLATTPVSVTAGGAYNRGTVVANGATGVPVAFADLKTTDVVKLALQVKGGTPSAMPALTKTAGTGFTLTSYALDTSTYSYEID